MKKSNKGRRVFQKKGEVAYLEKQSHLPEFEPDNRVVEPHNAQEEALTDDLLLRRINLVRDSRALPLLLSRKED